MFPMTELGPCVWGHKIQESNPIYYLIIRFIYPAFLLPEGFDHMPLCYYIKTYVNWLINTSRSFIDFSTIKLLEQWNFPEWRDALTTDWSFPQIALLLKAPGQGKNVDSHPQLPLTAVYLGKLQGRKEARCMAYSALGNAELVCIARYTWQNWPGRVLAPHPPYCVFCHRKETKLPSNESGLSLVRTGYSD